jgi:hypothetical protein
MNECAREAQAASHPAPAGTTGKVHELIDALCEGGPLLAHLLKNGRPTGGTRHARCKHAAKLRWKFVTAPGLRFIYCPDCVDTVGEETTR